MPAEIYDCDKSLQNNKMLHKRPVGPSSGVSCQRRGFSGFQELGSFVDCWWCPTAGTNRINLALSLAPVMWAFHQVSLVLLTIVVCIYGVGERNTTVSVLPGDGSGWKTVAIISICVSILLSVMLYCVWRRKGCHIQETPGHADSPRNTTEQQGNQVTKVERPTSVVHHVKSEYCLVNFGNKDASTPTDVDEKQSQLSLKGQHIMFGAHNKMYINVPTTEDQYHQKDTDEETNESDPLLVDNE
ncbi:hypothetical protein ScPMuIL_014006 [Solemya velum]